MTTGRRKQQSAAEQPIKNPVLKRLWIIQICGEKTRVKIEQALK